LANLVGLNVIGLRRKGVSKDESLALRRAYERLFFGEGEFRERLTRLEAESSGETLTAKMIAFIRAGKRALTMAVKRNEPDEEL
jgi:UDP-N-acetylglucosamine acyltransferase